MQHATYNSLTGAECAAGIPLTSDPHLAWVMCHVNAQLVAKEVLANRHCTVALRPTLNGMWTVEVCTPVDGTWWAA